jgi:hypothetical protein
VRISQQSIAKPYTSVFVSILISLHLPMLVALQVPSKIQCPPQLPSSCNPLIVGLNKLISLSNNFFKILSLVMLMLGSPNLAWIHIEHSTFILGLRLILSIDHFIRIFEAFKSLYNNTQLYVVFSSPMQWKPSIGFELIFDELDIGVDDFVSKEIL